jgi:hypothetical protein
VGDPREQLVWRLYHGAAIANQVASGEDRERVIGEHRDHVRTVRSAARSRNRPRRRLAWLLLAILVLLIALAVRLDAAPSAAFADPPDRAFDGGSDAALPATASKAGIALARRYADALTGGDTDHRWVHGDGDPADRAGDDRDRADEAPHDWAEEAARDRASDSGGDAIDRHIDDHAAGTAGDVETWEARSRGPLRWGRWDLGVAWQRRWTAPRYAPARLINEAWLLATWRQ